jgi:hypothetical protein
MERNEQMEESREQVEAWLSWARGSSSNEMVPIRLWNFLHWWAPNTLEYGCPCTVESGIRVLEHYLDHYLAAFPCTAGGAS